MRWAGSCRRSAWPCRASATWATMPPGWQSYLLPPGPRSAIAEGEYFSRSGLDSESVDKHKQETDLWWATLAPGISPMKSFLEQEVDILIPAAMEGPSPARMRRGSELRSWPRWPMADHA